MRGRDLLAAALLCAGCFSAVAGQALFVREESLAQLRDTRSTSSQTGDFSNSNNNFGGNLSGRSGRSGANGGRRPSQRRAPPPPDDSIQQQQQPQQRQQDSYQPPWDQSHVRRRPSHDARDSRDAVNGEEQDFLKTSQSQYPRQQYNQQFNNNNNNFNQKASQYQKPQAHVFQKPTGKGNDLNDLSNDPLNGQGQFGQTAFGQQHSTQFNNNFNRNPPPTGSQFGNGNQFASGNQFGHQQSSNGGNHDGRVNSQPRGSNFNTDTARTPTHFESTRNQFRQGRQFQNGSNQKPQQQALRQDQSQSSFRQEQPRQEQDQPSFRQQQTQQAFTQQPFNQQSNQQSFRQQQNQQPFRQQQNQQQYRQEASQQSFRQESFRQDQTHQGHSNTFNGFNNNNNNQGFDNNNNFNNNNFHQRPSAVVRNRTPSPNPSFNSFNSVSNNFQKVRGHNNDDNDIHRLSPATPPNNNNYVIFPSGGDDQVSFNNNIQQPFQRQPVVQQNQRTPAPLTGQRQVQPQSDAQPANRATRVPSQPQATVSIDQTVQSILNWIQGMTRAQERRARQQGVSQPSRQYLPVPEGTERPRPFQPATSPPTEPARQGQQGVTPPSREYLPVPEGPAGPGGPEGPAGPAGPATEAPRPFETPAPDAPTTGPAETPAPGGPEGGAEPEGPEPVNIPIPETPAPELETPAGPAPTEPAPGPEEAPATDAPATEAPATPAPDVPEAATPAAPQETPAPDTAAPEAPATEAPATEAPATPAPEAPTEGPAPEAPAETPEAPAETPAPEAQTEAPTEAPTPAPDAPAGPDEPAPGEPAAEGPGTTASPDDDGLHPPHIHAIDVQCAKDMMTITIEFDKPYDGIIYSKGFFKDPNCRYVQPNSNQIKYTFTVMLNSCGTQFVDDFGGGSGQAYLENVIVLQNEEGIQEVWDSIRSVRCLWEGNLKQALTVALSVGNLNQEIVTFGGDTGMAKLDIQVGRGPFAPAANGLVKIGEMMTLVVSVEGDPGFDVQVRACVARDADSTNLVQLTDGDGCVLKPKLLGAFQKTKETGNTGASILAYAFFQAFKFPDVMDLIIECSVDLCKTDCEMCPNPNQKLEPGAKRRRRRDVWSSSSNATQQLDSEGLVGDDLGVVMGRRLRVFTPDELPVDVLLEGGIAAAALQQQQYGDNVIHVPADASRHADGVCLSLPSVAASSALVLSLLTASCVLSATLWLKLQRARVAKLRGL